MVIRMICILLIGAALGFAFNASSPLGITFGAEDSGENSGINSPSSGGGNQGDSFNRDGWRGAGNNDPGQRWKQAEEGVRNGTLDGGRVEIQLPAEVRHSPASVNTQPQLSQQLQNPANQNHRELPVRPSVKPVRWFDVKSWIQAGQVTIIDVRSKAHFDAGHIPGAISLPFNAARTEYDLVLRQFDKDRQIVLYCSNTGCSLSRRMAVKIGNEFGFTNVQYMTGGVSRVAINPAIKY